MNTIASFLAKIVIVPLLGLFSLAGHPFTQPVIAPTQNVGAFNPSGGGTYRLESSIGISDTTINLSSFDEPISNTPYTMTYFGSTIEYATIDPQTPNRSEFVSFTGVIQNSDGTAELTGVQRGLSRTPGTTGCVASTTLAQAHSGNAIFILSNSPCFYSQYAVTQNNEAITGEWTIPAPTNPLDIANKQYVDSSITGTTTISTNKLVVAATAGQTVATGSLLYFNSGTAQWNNVNATNNVGTLDTVVGISQGSATVGINIPGGVMLQGLDTNQTGLTVGANYFASTIAGGIGTATTSLSVGVARTATNLYVSPKFTISNLPIPPVGTIMDNGSSTAPNGWLLTNGTSTGILRSTYSSLFSLIGTTYGAGDGATTFNLPFAAAGELTPPILDATSSNNTSGATSLTWTHTIGTAGTSTLLEVGVTTIGGMVAEVTYNGLIMATGTTQFGIGTSSTMYLVNPPAGAHSIIVTLLSGSHEIDALAASFFNVNTVSPFEGASIGFIRGATTTNTFLASTVRKNDLLVAFGESGGGFSTPLGLPQGWTFLGQVSGSNDLPFMAYYNGSLPASSGMALPFQTTQNAGALIVSSYQGMSTTTQYKIIKY